MATPSGVAEKALKRITAQLECSVCLDTLTDAKLLPCFHSFCKKQNVSSVWWSKIVMDTPYAAQPVAEPPRYLPLESQGCRPTFMLSICLRFEKR